MFKHSVQEEMAGYSNEHMCEAIADATKKLEFRSNQVLVIKHFLVGERRIPEHAYRQWDIIVLYTAT